MSSDCTEIELKKLKAKVRLLEQALKLLIAWSDGIDEEAEKSLFFILEQEFETDDSEELIDSVSRKDVIDQNDISPNEGKVGDCVEIIANVSLHGFELGEIVTITSIEVDGDEKYWVCSDAEGIEWCVTSDDGELL